MKLKDPPFGAFSRGRIKGISPLVLKGNGLVHRYLSQHDALKKNGCKRYVTFNFGYLVPGLCLFLMDNILNIQCVSGMVVNFPMS